nr:MAG TPA: hypothetical protein [Caudoviricetes sp.]
MQCTFCYKYKEKLVRFKWILWDVENPTNEELENVTWHAKSLFNNKERENIFIAWCVLVYMLAINGAFRD